MHGFLEQAAIFLLAAAVAAPLAKRAKVGSVLGYLIAGILIGPYGLGRFTNTYPAESVLQFAELGVVLLLFVIGLELQPRRLWAMRDAVFGYGFLQVLLTGALLALGGLWLGLAWQQAVYIGLALALSSTAFTLQVLGEKRELSTKHGRLAFSVLLFQDLAAIPILALVPLLTASAVAAPATGAAPSLLPSIVAAATAIGTIALVVIGGRLVLGRVYRLVASTGLREAMTATALLTVIVVALIMEAAGLSAALGAFIAGALLADSEYRHAVEADIEPFEGLLLGLFFTAIGMSLNLALAAGSPGTVLGIVAAFMAIKTAALYIVGRLYRLNNDGARRLGLACSQGGEFAFVLFSTAVTAGLLGRELGETLAVAVTLSMMATPLLLILDDAIVQRRPRVAPIYDVMPQEEGHVIVAGFGRFGQIVARVLRAKGIPMTVLEISSEQVDFVRQFGSKIHYGDAARLDILRAAQADKARAFVLAIDDVEASMKAAEIVRAHFPDLKIYARARNRQHAYRLLDLGIEVIRRETFESAVEMSRDVLRGLGYREAEVRRTVDTFRKFDERRLNEDYKHASDTERLKARARSSVEELENLFKLDAAEAAKEEAARAPRPLKSTAT
jgi:monovalent cation:proton antiporter-2 (CPA2) family protein